VACGRLAARPDRPSHGLRQPAEATPPVSAVVCIPVASAMFAPLLVEQNPHPAVWPGAGNGRHDLASNRMVMSSWSVPRSSACASQSVSVGMPRTRRPAYSSAASGASPKLAYCATRTQAEIAPGLRQELNRPGRGHDAYARTWSQHANPSRLPRSSALRGGEPEDI
jgi:hypothetical protein